MSYLLNFMAWHAASSGHAQLGAQLLGAAEAVQLGVGANVMPFLAPPLPQVPEIGVAALGASCIDAEFGTGQRLAQDELVALALGTRLAEKPATVSTKAPRPLANRQLDVA